MSAAFIISVVIFLVILYSGYLNGLFSSVTTLLLLTVGIAFSMSFYTRLAETRLCQPMGDYAEPVCLAVLFVLGYFALQIVANVFAPPMMHMKRIVNKVGGIGVNVGTAMLMTGFMGMLFYMTPWTGIHKGSGEFIGAHLVARGFEQMTLVTGGVRFDADEFFKRLKKNECDRVCRRNLQNICIRLSDVYKNRDTFDPLTEMKLRNAVVNGKNLRAEDDSGGKGVGDAGIICPHNDKPYEFRVLRFRDIPHRSKTRSGVIHVYDPEASHDLNGKPAHMVLRTWKNNRGKLKSKIELIPKEEFKEELKRQREELGTGE